MTRIRPTTPVSNTVRSYPRSLEQAFGPYARRGEIVPMPEQRSAFDRALPYVYAACAVGAVAAVLFNNYR
jgi:hypothetical protein